MNDNYLQLLEYLEQWGIDREVQVDHILYDWFRNQISVDPDEHTNSISGRIAHFVDEMHDSKHIRLNKVDTTTNEITTWYVSARLTSWGLEYLNNYRLVQSNLNLNGSIRTNIRVQIGIGILTLLAIAVTALYAVKVYYKDDPKILKLIQKSMQRQEQQSDSILQLQKERNTYLKLLAKKDTAKNH